MLFAKLARWCGGRAHGLSGFDHIFNGFLWVILCCAAVVELTAELATYPIWRPLLWAWRKVRR